MTRPLRLPCLLVAVALLATALPLISSGEPATALDMAPWTNPVAPPRCTQTQMDSGNVAGCLLRRYSDPAADGFGDAPAPAVGRGWMWSGHTYSGSPALAMFESDHIAANTKQIGSVNPGTLETNRAAQALFEGFLEELQAQGYAVRHVSGYSFRCTGDWDCSTGGPDDLSLHAWGLAIDMNSDRNPIRTYADCATPVETDFPRWAIETAERWGLYWGGYGWNSDCNGLRSGNTDVGRDTPHFEFRGTPAIARAIAAYNHANDPSAVCFDTVDESGANVEQCARSGVPEARWRLPVPLAGAPQPPPGATAALVNLTATDAAAPGYLSIEDCAARAAGPRQTSALTYMPGEAVASLAIVPLGTDPRLCVYRASPVHSVVDVVGYLVSASTAGDQARWVVPATPARVLDTRSASPIAGGSERDVQGLAGDALVNLATVADGGAGYLQAGTCGALGANAKFSHVNYAGRTAAGPTIRSNLTLIRGGGSDACVFSLADAHVVVDALATLDPAAGLGWRVGNARRVLDTRERPGGMPAAGDLIEVDVGTSDPAAVVAVTATGASHAGYLSVARCDELRAAIGAHGTPATSNLNHGSGQTVTNLATSGLDAGKLCVYTRAAGHVIVDVQATLTADQAVAVVPVDPARLHDSRSAGR